MKYLKKAKYCVTNCKCKVNFLLSKKKISCEFENGTNSSIQSNSHDSVLVLLFKLSQLCPF